MNVRYGSSTVLDRIDLRIARCDIFTIVGPNGSGKSTLLRTLIGGVQPSAERFAAHRDFASATFHSDWTSTRPFP